MKVIKKGCTVHPGRKAVYDSNGGPLGICRRCRKRREKGRKSKGKRKR
jgi:hypothetical protein